MTNGAPILIVVIVVLGAVLWALSSIAIARARQIGNDPLDNDANALGIGGGADGFHDDGVTHVR